MNKFYFSTKKSPLEATIDELLKKSDVTTETKLISKAMIVGKFDHKLKEFKLSIKHLYLLHAFTPSGMHLAAVLWPLKHILPKLVFKIFLICLGPALFILFPGQFALFRCWGITLLGNLLHISPVTSIITIFATDLFFGSFSRSSYSFAFSYMFIGILMLKKPGIGSSYWWLIGNVLIQHFFSSTINVTGFIFGVLLSPFYGISFPILLFSMCISVASLKPLFWALNLFQLLLDYTKMMVEIALGMPQFMISSEIIFVLIFISSFRRNGLIVLLFFLPTLTNVDQKYDQLKAKNIYKSYGLKK